MLKTIHYTIDTNNFSGSLIVTDRKKLNKLRKKMGMKILEEPIIKKKAQPNPKIISIPKTKTKTKIERISIKLPKSPKYIQPTIIKEEPIFKLSRPRSFLIKEENRLLDNYIYFVPLGEDEEY